MSLYFEKHGKVPMIFSCLQAYVSLNTCRRDQKKYVPIVYCNVVGQVSFHKLTVASYAATKTHHKFSRAKDK